MFDRARVALAILACLLGMGHLIVGVMSYSEFSLDALWFTGAGVAMICVAIGNLSARGANLRDRLAQTFQNLIVFAYFLAAWTVLPAPQVAVGAILFGALALIRISELKAKTISV